jgi:hypothetical protein
VSVSEAASREWERHGRFQATREPQIYHPPRTKYQGEDGSVSRSRNDFRSQNQEALARRARNVALNDRTGMANERNPGWEGWRGSVSWAEQPRSGGGLPPPGGRLGKKTSREDRATTDGSLHAAEAGMIVRQREATAQKNSTMVRRRAEAIALRAQGATREHRREALLSVP